VIHVPLYLNALWEACELKAKGRITWKQMQINDQSTQLFGKHHDTVIYAAGAGIVQNEMLHSKDDLCLPVQLIRGQSIIMSTPKENEYISSEALLCGKYISPMPLSVQSEAKERSFVIGATHEFKSTKLDEAEVVNELKQRCYQLSPYLWETGVVKKFTSGVRMQSNRGKYGRMPIVGRLDNSSWIFTGLSSRGLIYHGLFGRWLAEAVLQDNEQTLSEYFEEFDWWKQKKDRSELKS
jgi:glycine/D-amino acid oxidase-like deaminating enzyme